MEQLDKTDLQALVARGHGTLPWAQFLLLEVRDAERARGYLRGICGEITRADKEPDQEQEQERDTHALQIAFTRAGLEMLGVPKTAVATFAREFIEGMADEVRAQALGDDPATWTWGSKSKDAIHVLLLIYAKDEPTLEVRVANERRAIEAGAFRVVAAKPSALLPRQKEHFGWKDGISIPQIEGLARLDKPEVPTWTFPFRAGEFVLGYKNEYDAYTESPTVELADDPDDHLLGTSDGTAKDLGLNGTYLVYREMTQDVLEFWDYLERESREPGADRVEAAIALGAKMVGRWPGGAPLRTSPHAYDVPRADDNDFTYHERDHGGLACPLGAHIRRTNPRDQLPSDHDAEDSVEMVRKHQMLRRGRPFGAPLAPSMDPRDFLAMRGQPDPEVRGLHFICLVGHIGRQFEFVQRGWINSPNFAALFKDADPIVGVHRPPPDANVSDEFTCPAEPLRTKYTRLPQFTRVVGGAYFFLPSIRALRFIANPRQA